MAADSDKSVSIPEDLSFGELEALFRSRRRLSRSQLVLLMERELLGNPEKYPQRDAEPSESLLRQIEDDNRVKITPFLIELLCDALQCSSAERFALRIAAGRNPLAGPNGKADGGSRLLLRIVDEVNRHSKARDLLEELARSNKDKVANLTQHDLFEILEMILMAVKS